MRDQGEPRRQRSSEHVLKGREQQQLAYLARLSQLKAERNALTDFDSAADSDSVTEQITPEKIRENQLYRDRIRVRRSEIQAQITKVMQQIQRWQ